MKILLCHRFFWPDSPPYASMLRGIGAHLAATGHSVSVFSAQPSYRPGASVASQPSQETLDGMQVQRVSLLKERQKDILVRGANALLFSIRLFLHIVARQRYDVVVVSTFPPVILGAAACLACKLKGVHFVYHCMDIHPEVSMISSNSSTRTRFSILRRIDAWTCRNASAVIVLSQDMSKTLRARKGHGNPRLFVINNFDLPDFEAREQAEIDGGSDNSADAEDGRSKDLEILFAGNLGRFQSLDVVVRAAALLKTEDIRVHLMGDGAMKDRLRNLATGLGCNNVDFTPFQPPSVAKRMMSEADFGLVTLREGMYRVAYPSKTMTYLATGCPLIVMVEESSELARTVRGNRLGYVVSEPDPSVLAQAMKDAFARRDFWRAQRSRLQAYAAETSSAKTVYRAWDELLSTLDSDAG